MPALLLLLSGCVSIPEAVRELPDGLYIEIPDTPFFPQERYQCGPAALATVLVASGVSASPADLVDEVYLPGRRGSLQLELVAATRRHERVPYVIEGTLAAILAEIETGRPVLVLQNLGVAAIPRWHYAVVVGVDAGSGDVILRSGTDQRRVTRIDTFLMTWRRSGYWGMVALRPGELPAIVDRPRYFSAIAALEATGRAATASVAWHAAAQRWPEDSTVLFGIANTEFELGRLEAAETAYRDLLARDATLTVARNNLALVLAQQRQFDAAAEEISTAIRLNEDPLLDDELEDSARQIRQMAAESD